MQYTTDRLEQNLRRPGGASRAVSTHGCGARTCAPQERLAAQARQARRVFPQLMDDPEPPAELPEPPSAADEHDDDISLVHWNPRSRRPRTRWRSSKNRAHPAATTRTPAIASAARRTGVFFAFLLSVAVIVAGVAPLVEADSDERRLILLWTVVVCVAAGIVYAIVRAGSRRARAPRDPPMDDLGANPCGSLRGRSPA